jgi:hypothetical protein
MNQDKLAAARNDLGAVLALFNLDSLHDYQSKVMQAGVCLSMNCLGVYEETLQEMMDLLPDFEYQELRRNPENNFLRVSIQKKSSN